MVEWLKEVLAAVLGSAISLIGKEIFDRRLARKEKIAKRFQPVAEKLMCITDHLGRHNFYAGISQLAWAHFQEADLFLERLPKESYFPDAKIQKEFCDICEQVDTFVQKISKLCTQTSNGLIATYDPARDGIAQKTSCVKDGNELDELATKLLTSWKSFSGLVNEKT